MLKLFSNKKINFFAGFVLASIVFGLIFFIIFSQPVISKFLAKIPYLWSPETTVYLSQPKFDQKLIKALSEKNKVRVIVKLKSQESKLALHFRDFEEKYNFQDYKVGFLTKAGLENLKNNREVLNIALDKEVRAFLQNTEGTDGPLDKETLEYLQKSNSTGKGQTICLIDTGIDYNLEPLKNNYLGGIDFVNNDDEPMDDQGHGTMMANIITKIAPETKIVAVKVINQEGVGYSSDVIRGIYWCMENKEKYKISVINLSLGQDGYNGYCDDDLLAKSANLASKFDLIVVAAAGDQGKEMITSPACASLAISVGSTDEKGQIATFSNFHHTLDILAPGVKLNTLNNEKASGTSVSAAYVSAIAALLLEKEETNVDYRLKATSDLMEKEGVVYNVLNIKNAIEYKRTYNPTAKGGCQGEKINQQNLSAQNIIYKMAATCAAGGDNTNACCTTFCDAGAFAQIGCNNCGFYYSSAWNWSMEDEYFNNACCCGDDSLEVHQYCKQTGSPPPWSSGCTSSVADCCYTTNQCVDTSGYCQTDLGDDRYCKAGTWEDCDNSQTNCAVAVCSGSSSNWAVGGSGDCTGEYCLTQCCGDDSVEFRRTGGIGSPTTTCCDVNTDCVESGFCRATTAYASSTCYNSCSRALCSSGSWSGSSCTGSVTCSGGSCTETCSSTCGSDTWANTRTRGTCAAGGTSGCPSGSRCCVGNTGGIPDTNFGTSCLSYDDDYASGACSLDVRAWTTVTTGDLETDSSNCTAGVTYCGDGVPSNGFCCGDDTNENYRTGGIGSGTVACCDSGTDCVESGFCRATTAYASSTCYNSCSRALCSSGSWTGSACSGSVTCSGGSCTTTCETDCGASASCDAKTYNADVCTNNVALTFCSSSCVSSAGDGKCESNGVNGCSSAANCDEKEENEEVCDANKVQTGVCSSTCSWATTGAGTCEYDASGTNGCSASSQCDELEENEEVCNASSVQTGVCSSACAWATTGAGTCEAGGGINSCSADTWADERATGACAAGGSSGCPSGSRCCAGNGTYGTACKAYDDDYSSAICTSLDARTWTTVTTGDLETDSSNCTAGVTYCGDGTASNGFCCGDDTSENYVTQGVGSGACCDSASDCVDSGNVCRTEWSTEVTCSDGIDNDCDGNTDAADTDCVSYTPKSQNWKWYDDEWDCDSSVSTHDAGQTCANSANGSALAAENTVPTGIGKLNANKLRITINETGGVTGTEVRMIIQYAQKVGSDCNDGDESFTTVSAIGTPGAVWRYYNGTAGTNDTDDAILGANRLSDSGSNKATHNETSTVPSTFDHTASTAFEWEFSIQNFNGTANTSYCFKIYDNTNAAAVLTNTGETLPELTTASAYDLSFNAPNSAGMPDYQLGTGGSNSNQFTDKDITVRDTRGTGAGWALTATSNDWSSGTDTIPDDDIDWTTDTIKAEYAENTSCSSGVGVCAGTANSSFASEPVTLMDADADTDGPYEPGWGGYVIDAWTLRIINIDVRLIGTYNGTISFSLT